MRQPSECFATSLLVKSMTEGPVIASQFTGSNYVRPAPHVVGFFHRWRMAWAVFTGRADALFWFA